MEDRLPPIETPLAQQVANFKRRYVPVMVWSVAAVACAWMLTDRAIRFEYIGLAQAVQYEVSASTTGQLDMLLVSLYDAVHAGDPVAKLDDTELNARIERAHATIRQLNAQLTATRVQLLAGGQMDQASWTNDLRRFQTDEEDRRLAALELRVTVESDQIELERLALRVATSRTLLGNGLIGQNEHDSIALLHGETRKRIDENQILLLRTQSEYRTAKDRRLAFEAKLPSTPDAEPMLEPLRAAIDVEEKRLEEIQIRRQATVLRSPVTGQISSILCQRGQTVVPGEPILTVADGTVTEILAFLNEADSEMARANAPVLVARMSRPERVAESVVMRLGPDIEILPERLWRVPSTPEYGRAVVIAAVPTLQLTPGELLNVRLIKD